MEASKRKPSKLANYLIHLLMIFTRTEMGKVSSFLVSRRQYGSFFFFKSCKDDIYPCVESKLCGIFMDKNMTTNGEVFVVVEVILLIDT